LRKVAGEALGDRLSVSADDERAGTRVTTWESVLHDVLKGRYIGGSAEKLLNKKQAPTPFDSRFAQLLSG